MRWATLATLALLSALGAGACSSTTSEYPGVLLPCDDPAPLGGMPSPPSLGYIVDLQDGSDQAAEAARLAAQCGFQVDEVSSAGEWFTAQLDLVELGCVRCDPVVTLVEPNAAVFPQ